MCILLVEDSSDLSNNICLTLNQADYRTDQCYTGSGGLCYASNQIYDVIILDRMLPEMDGMPLLSALRRKGTFTPVILTTALDGPHDHTDGLDTGADDYIVEPFDVEELMARIRAVTRRSGVLKISPDLTFTGITFHPEQHLTSYQDTNVTLSKKEAALFEYFIRNANQTLPRLLILSYIWGADTGVEERNLDNYICFLRRRLKALGAPVRLTTVHGVGYRLEEAHA